jgi:serine protease AprX
MKFTPRRRGITWTRLAVAGALAPVGALALAAPAFADTQGGGAAATPQNVIIQYGSSSAAAALVGQVAPGSPVTGSMDSVGAVAAVVPSTAIGQLQSDGAIVTPNEPVAFSGGLAATSCPAFGSSSTPSGYFRQDSGAQILNWAGDTGRGVTVAVLDTGINGSLPDFGNRLIGGVDLTGGNSPFTDQYGHGTFVAGLIAGNGASNGQPGEAPGADLVSIKVAGADGQTTISSIVQGIYWAVQNRDAYHIQVLNLSLGAIPTGPTATEVMDHAVEAAWNAGITVVVAAGNAGPNAGTITSPGDDPLAVTVGAYADNDSPSPANWYACPFSSVGPTLYDAWLKPDLVAPGRSVISLLDPGSTIANQNPGSVIGTGGFVGSGTSFSTAITAGSVALILSAHPGINPDQVKGRLLGTALPAETTAPLIEGHGYLNALLATAGPALTYNQAAARVAEANSSGSNGSINLGQTWAPSSWNPANYGLGSQWTSTGWNGSQWTGSQWTGSQWTGSQWTGSQWTGSQWTGSQWTGSQWTGSQWTGSQWTGSQWTGSQWTGINWNGSQWTGSQWTGSQWTTASWLGSQWTGSAWTGSQWTGSQWTGSQWTSSQWTGSQWTGSQWTGSQWTGSQWSGSQWS